MISKVLLVVFAVAGIGLGVGYNFLVIKKYPDNKRKGGYILTVIVFLLVTIALFSIISVKIFVNKTVPEKSLELVDYIEKNHSDVGFVRNGFDLTGMNNDVSKLNNTVADLKKVLPSHTDLGLPKGLYDFGADFLIKELQRRLVVVNISGKAVNAFADESNKLTVSSVIDGLQKRIMKIVNVILFILASIFVIIFLIHIIVSLVIVRRKDNQSGVVFG